MTATLDRPPVSTPPEAPLTRRRVRPRDFKGSDAALLGLTLLSALCVTWIIFAQLTLFSGIFGFIVAVAVIFLLFYYLVNRQLFGSRVAADRATGALVCIGVLCMLTPLVLLVAFLFIKGFHYLSLSFLTHTQFGVVQHCAAGQANCIPKGGVFQAILGTFEQVGFAVLIGVPAGILTAVFLNEVGGRLTQPVRVVVTAMSGLPAIVAGIFVYSVLVLHFGVSGFAGSLALAILLLPTVTRGTEEVLKIVPDDLREASAALGAPQWRTVWSVVLPTARSGILTAVLLGIAVAIGETAPLLFTVFGSPSANWNLFHGPQASLPLMIYESVRSSSNANVALGYTAGLVLFLLVFAVFILARILGSPWLGRTVRARSNKRMAEAAARSIRGGVVD